MQYLCTAHTKRAGAAVVNQIQHQTVGIAGPLCYGLLQILILGVTVNIVQTPIAVQIKGCIGAQIVDGFPGKALKGGCVVGKVAAGLGGVP